MAAPASSYRKLIAFGRTFSVDADEDYKAAAKTYAEEASLIAQMRQQLKDDGMTVTKEYVKGRENICTNPAIAEYNKTSTAANSTVDTLMRIIEKLAEKTEEESGFSKMMRELAGDA